MSRIGKQPIKLPTGVTAEVISGGEYNHQLVKISGPKGTLERALRPEVSAAIEDGVLTISRKDDAKQSKAYHGLYRALLANMVEGVNTGFKRELEIVGIGYRAEMQGDKLVLSLGYSHKIDFYPPQGVTVTVSNQTELAIEGADNQLVGETAAKIRAFRKPEPYKGKGVKFKEEIIRRKSVKKA